MPNQKGPAQPKLSQGGFAPILLLLVVPALLIFGFMIFQKAQEKGLPPVFQQSQNEHSKGRVQAEWPVLWGAPDNQNKCKKDESVKFSSLPLGLEDVSYVEPIGELRESHIVPGDHGGFNYKTSPASTPVKVFAPADGFLVGVEKHPYTPPPGYPALKHYHFYLEHSCTLFTGFVHLTEFTSEMLAASAELKTLDGDTNGQFKTIAPRIPVRAGQQIGTAWSFGLLGWVTVDLTAVNKGYLNPESYRKAENWRIHSVAGFDYFTEPLKTQIMAKNPRTAAPRGGKIDFDTPGKLVGNWFEKGTGGLRDTSIEPKQCGNFPCPYWDGHIAFVYDYVDPDQLRVSVGHDWGLSGRTPFGVKGNAPDFENIGMANGVVKHELVALKDISREKGYDTESPLITVNDETQVLGTILIQLTDEDTLKVEIFPGKTKDQVSSFTSQARTYTR